MPSFKAFAEFQKKAQEAVASAKSQSSAVPQEDDVSNTSNSAESQATKDVTMPKPRVEEPLKIGMMVRVKGLQARPELNGLEGVLTSLDEARSRWQVELKNGGGAKLFKAANLEQVLSDQDALEILKGRSKVPLISEPKVVAEDSHQNEPPNVAAEEASAARKPLISSTQGAQKSFLASSINRANTAEGPSAAAIAAAAALAKGGRKNPEKASDASAGTSAGYPSGNAAAQAVSVEASETTDEDDDEAFVRSIEHCLKECDVMWDDY
eukprot:TRINITY_DN84322_c0_g1_i1.p1 TRINITY_DN84322_c0_g1~~TRINITY_DN84322_c0_g1_i1.p1  ORF type:complete len:267 (-),score=69.82 TRINITY_DN84322_c0_g1_i1:45-845(-)